jgi:hypothetical protein
MPFFLFHVTLPFLNSISIHSLFHILVIHIWYMMKEFRIIISELSAFYRIRACMFKVIKKVIYKWSSIEIFWKKKKRTSCFAFCLPKWKSHFFFKKNRL